jgi:hypothetical protein
VNAPRTIFVIRHGEKPEDLPLEPVDLAGDRSKRSLVPRGWQRAGALAVLFAPQVGPLRPGILTPDQLIVPDYGKGQKDERTHETIEPLEKLLGLEHERPCAVGEEQQLGEQLSAAETGVTLVCWEHTHAPSIFAAISPARGPLPTEWPGDRYDVIWSLTRNDGVFEFAQVGQRLLAGDM